MTGRSVPYWPRAGWAVLGCLALGIVTALYAGLLLRGLFADGVNFLLPMLSTRSVVIQMPSRVTSVALLQAPTLAALWLGADRLSTVAGLYSVTLNVLPLLGIALCFPILPRERRAFFLLPAFAAFGGIYAAWYAAVVEGPITAAFFWVAFTLIVFGRERLLWRILLVALALPMLELLEPMVFLGPVLALACLQRRTASTQRGTRILLILLALWFLAVAVHAGTEILRPTVPGNRDGFIRQFLGLWWLYTPGGWINGPAIVTVCAGAAILAAMLCPDWSDLLLGAFGATAILFTAGAFATDRLIAPQAQFYARYLADLLSLPLALLALASLRWPALTARWATAPSLAIVLMLGLAGAAWNVAAARDWDRYATAFRAVLARHDGLIPWETAIGELSRDDAVMFKRLDWVWTTPGLSIVLSPGGRVHAIIDNNPDHGWIPFDPADTAQLPTSPLFSTEEYRAALARAKP